MESIGVIFAMLIAIVISGVIVRVIPWGIPLPLIQILLGIVIAGVFQEGMELHPDVFFLLFLPPLLFLDGWRISKEALKRERASIFHLAFGLVIITVFGLGFIIHWLIPAMPLPVAFALAAIVSPTDPIAVAGIARKLAVPERILSILEGEALFNDASGLVAFRMAILVMMTGHFSLSEAVMSFVWVAFAGFCTGIIITWLLSFFRGQFTKKYGEDIGAEILLNILMPFAAYVAAEHIGASGILAAVAAGLTMSYLELSGQVSPLTRMRRATIWDTVQFTLNGMMFVLLGEQLPNIFKGAVQVVQQTGHHNPWWLIIYASVICLSLAALRFGWVFFSIHVLRWLKKTPKNQSQQATLRDILILSLGGVRGAVTLAGVLTLPLLLPNQEAFPARDLAIFLAATVIIISLITASILLPWLLKKQNLAPQAIARPLHKQQTLALQMAQDAITKHLSGLLPSLQKAYPQIEPNFYTAVLERVLVEFSNSLDPAPDTNSESYQKYLSEKQIRLMAIDTARQTIYRLARDQKISDDVARDMVKQLDFDEIRFTP